MVYLTRGAHHPALAKLFCVCCVLASLGTGAMTQSGAIAEAVSAVTPLSPLLVSIVTAALAVRARVSRVAAVLAVVVKATGDLAIFSTRHRPTVEAGDTVWTFVPPDDPKARREAKEASAAV